MKEYVGIYNYQNQKSTGTRWLWQQNEIPLPCNNRTCFAFTLVIYTYVDPNIPLRYYMDELNSHFLTIHSYNY